MSQEIEKKQASAIQANGSKRGLEEPTEQSDLIIPRAKLMQGLSPELDTNHDLRSGMIINSITQEVLPEVFVPIFKFTNWIRFNPRATDAPGFDPNFEPGDIIWRSNDPNDARVQTEGVFGPNGERPLATKFLNFFSVFEGGEMPVVVSFCNTSFKTGKQLLSLCKFTPGDIFSRRYRLSSRRVENDKGIFNVFTIGLAGMATPEEYALAERMYKEFQFKEFRVHEEAEPPEAETAPF